MVQQHTLVRRAAPVVLVTLALAGLLSIARDAAWLARKVGVRLPRSSAKGDIAISKLPGPPRSGDGSGFTLDDSNSVRMVGTDDSWNERWADISGNYYSAAFIKGFSYRNNGPAAPVVRVQVTSSGATLNGRLEARGLKPNFAYQIKLRGDFKRDPASAEAIGYVGRWRLPGRPTNYTDRDYERSANKENIEAYVLFDFFVTDKHGNAVRNFALDSSLHVLWNARRQRSSVPVHDVVEAVVEAGDPGVYLRPKPWRKAELIWAERERGRYETDADVIQLPPGDYNAELVLTEESFHSADQDGGFWATPLACPVGFTVVATDRPPTQASPR